VTARECLRNRLVSTPLADLVDEVERLQASNAELLEACCLAHARLQQFGLDWLGKGPDPLETAIANAQKARTP